MPEPFSEECMSVFDVYIYKTIIKMAEIRNADVFEEVYLVINNIKFNN